MRGWRNRLRQAAVLIGWVVAYGHAAGAEVVTLDVLLNVDLDPATGCDVTTVDGPAYGIESRVRTRFDVGTETVLSTTHADCIDPVAGTFAAETAIPSPPIPPWSVVSGNGTAGSTLIESHLPLSTWAATEWIQATVVIDSIVGQDAMLQDGVGSPMLLQMGAPQVFSLSPLAWTGLAILCGWVGRTATKRGRGDEDRTALACGAVAVFLVLMLEPGSGIALLGDGSQRTWVQQEQLGVDPEADAPAGIDLLSFYAAVDSTEQELWLRIDVLFGAPVCLDWGRVDPGSGASCSQEPPPDLGPFNGRIAITFDDGPNLVSTPSVIATLRANQIPATFFVRGDRLVTPAEQALAVEMHQDPLFRVANHSTNHPWFPALDAQHIEDELSIASDRIRTAIGDPCYFPAYFRFPYSATNCLAMDIARSHGHAVVGFNIGPADWCFAANGGSCPAPNIPGMPDEYRDDLPGLAVHLFQASGGGIMILHDIHTNTADELPAIIAGLQAAGATFVDLDDPSMLPLLNASIMTPQPPACCEGVVH